MKPGEIYLGRFPFGDIAGMKATLHGTSLVRRLGELSPEAAGIVTEKLRAWLSL